MSLALWRSPLARALHRNRSLIHARYLQLATVRLDGRPANRTVVFRGFLKSGDRLQFVTDSRSEKASQIEAQPWAEVCWYFPKTREQFRVLGKLILVQADCADAELAHAHRLLWQNLSDSARLQFAWSDPGQPTDPGDQFKLPIPDSQNPLSNFCLLLLDPYQVDHLELRGDPQKRYRYQRDEHAEDAVWSVQAVNP